MIFRKRGTISYTWFHNENPIEIVNTLSGNSVLVYWLFLGNPVSFSTTRQESVVLLKKRKIKQLLNNDPVIKCDLFDKLVLPILMYAASFGVFIPLRQLNKFINIVVKPF